MAKSNHVETDLFSTTHPHVSKHTSVYSILTSLGIALAGILCVVFSLDLDASSSTISMLLLTLGTILILFALYRLFWKSSETVYLPTGSTITEGSYYVDSAELDVLKNMMDTRNFKHAGISFKQSGNGRMDYVVSKDGKFMGVQLYHFVPYTYEPLSGIYYYTDADAMAFKRYLETHIK